METGDDAIPVAMSAGIIRLSAFSSIEQYFPTTSRAVSWVP